MGLAQDQPVRRLMDPEGAKQIDDYVAKIESLLTLKDPFHVVRIFMKQYCDLTEISQFCACFFESIRTPKALNLCHFMHLVEYEE